MSNLILNKKDMEYLLNIKGVQNKNKRFSIIAYFKNKIDKNGTLFLQETHSTASDKGKWKDEFNGPTFYLLLALVVYWPHSLGKIKHELIVKLLTNMDKY